MGQMFRENQERISWILFISAIVVLSSFVIFGYFTPRGVWISYLWVSDIAFILLLLGCFIEIKRLNGIVEKTMGK